MPTMISERAVDSDESNIEQSLPVDQKCARSDAKGECGHSHSAGHPQPGFLTPAPHKHDHKTEQTIVSLDTLGIAASTLCIIHCLAMPFIIAALPFLGLQFLEGNLAHQVLAGFVLCFALFAVLPGYLKHRRTPVLIGMSVGLLLVLFATFGANHCLGETWELPLISIGNLLLVGTHLWNRGLLKCDHSH
jgi:xanthine/uracil permease